MAALTPASPEDRADAAAFVGRVARWDPAGPVRLVSGGDRVTLWGTTPFDTLVTRSVWGALHPREVTVRSADLLAGLAVSSAEVVDPGRGAEETWRDRIPPDDGWITLDVVPAATISDLVASGAAQAREYPGGGGAPESLLDAEVLTVTGADQTVTVPLRMLFALSGMGFGGPGDDVIKVRSTRIWLRLDGRFGAVVRRRHASLPLFV